ncbi:FAS1-like dehydratase domain-containing protein [Pluralibacter gergoviae]|uniref:FAS1-like dehydratase domain-containing protein n=1 Tax=Pluralibacter gergoviae TaxID=61647 RepID=UPI0009BBC38F|nr:MaoC family dehydratase N-terminal domain-containing protein [Pluralibacter gergoviae]
MHVHDMHAPDLHRWRPEAQRLTDLLVPGPARRLAATLDRRGDDLRSGAPLPPLWHWLYFLPADPQSALAADGHPQKGAFLPPVSLPRRMWAAGTLTWHSPLRLGESVERTSQVKGIEEKEGASGRLVFVEVEHRYRTGERDLLTEVHTIVYREAVTGAPATRRASAPLPEAQFSREILPDPRLLFRYSALTFNTHRIHYDLDYVTREEHYPGLVVHGPLTATLLMDLLREHAPAAEIRSMAFRALSPLFSPAPVRLNGRIDGDTATLWATGPDGQTAMKATVQIN